MQEQELEQFYISYKRTLEKMEKLNIKTKKGKKINYNILVEAINIMNKKHFRCRWKFKKYDSGKKFILIEGYYWLIYVFFQNKKSLIDADIEFFENRIKQYEQLLQLNPKKLWDKNLDIKKMADYFNRDERTIKRGIAFMKQKVGDKFILKNGKKIIILKKGIEWLCKNYFKKKYLRLLEDYKMELTEKYIRKGYIYDYTNIIGI